MKSTRKNLRLKHYDYSKSGAYFVTVCVRERTCLFGNVTDGMMVANPAGKMIEEWWWKLPAKFPGIVADTYVVMPNHFHGIVVIVGADLCVRPGPGAKPTQGAHAGAPLPTLMQWFKTMTTNAYIRGVKDHAWTVFPGKLWQRNYHEHVIRNDGELSTIRDCIVNNPLQWSLDRENPAATGRIASTDCAAIFAGELP